MIGEASAVDDPCSLRDLDEIALTDSCDAAILDQHDAIGDRCVGGTGVNGATDESRAAASVGTSLTRGGAIKR